MQPNPYTPGEIPRLLAGRDAQLARIGSVLDRVTAYGEMGGPLTVFHGPRGVGKTSLLRSAQRRAEEAGFLTSWIAGVDGEPLLPDLVNRVNRTIEDGDVLQTDRRGWHMRVERVRVELGIPWGARAGVEFGRSRDDDASGAALSGVEDLLHDAAVRTRARGGAGLAVFLDEVHAPPRRDLAIVLNALQNLNGRREDNPIAVVGAGLPSTPGILTRAATFGERTAFVPLRRLDETDAGAAVARPARELEVAWDPDALRAVVDLAKGFPYLLQVHAHATWEAARPEAGDVIGTSAVGAGRATADEQLSSMFTARWNAASDLEQRFLVAMADDGRDDVPRAAVAAALGQDSRSLSVPRSRLIDKGIIEPSPRRGHVRFTLPGFGAHVRVLDRG